MAIDIDMKRAYDKLEWNFIKRYLTNLGCCDRWISWRIHWYYYEHF